MASKLYILFRRPAALLLWAAVLCVACSKTQTEEAPEELSLRAAAAVTKVDPELSGASLGTDNTYVIYASASTAEQPSYLLDQLFQYNGADAKWHAAPDPVYWPLQGIPVDFLALAMKPAAHTTLMPIWLSASTVIFPEWDVARNQYDLMYAVKNGQSNVGTVPLVFDHALAVVGFTAKCDTEADVYTLKDIRLEDLQYRGTLTVDNSRTTPSLTWDVLHDEAHIAARQVPLLADDFSVPGPTATVAASKCTNHMLVMPQMSRSVTLIYHVRNSIPDLTFTLPLPRMAWKAGFRYIYNLTFSATAITVSSIVVSSWDGTPLEVIETIS